MGEIAPPLIVFILASLVVARLLRRGYTSIERRLLAVSFVAHALSAIVLVWVTDSVYEGGSDTAVYIYFGRQLSRLLDLDFTRHIGDVLALLFHLDERLPLEVHGSGISTGTMSAISGLLFYFLGGSVYAAFISLSFSAFLGNLALYRSFRIWLPTEFHLRLAVAATLVPSVVFWSAGIVKESLAITGLGIAHLAVSKILQRRLFSGVLLAALGGLMIGLVKAYILFPLAVAAGAWILLQQTQRLRASPLRAIIGGAFAAALALAVTAILSQQFPEYALDTLGAHLSQQQINASGQDAGSQYTMGNEGVDTLGGQVTFLPLALGTALFRPLMFEVRNPQMFAAALEVTLLSILLARGVWRNSLMGTLQLLRRVPLLAFSVTFTLLFASAVGLATANLGTLSRYRMPHMPFLMMFALVLNGPQSILSRLRTAGPIEEAVPMVGGSI